MTFLSQLLCIKPVAHRYAFNQSPNNASFIRRFQELQQETAISEQKPSYGQIVRIVGSQMNAQVIEASMVSPVILHMNCESSRQCLSYTIAIRKLCKKYTFLKFVQVDAKELIPDYPESKTPTIVVFLKGQVVIKWETLDPFGGDKPFSPRYFEIELAKLGLIPPAILIAPPLSLYDVMMMEDDCDDDDEDEMEEEERMRRQRLRFKCMEEVKMAEEEAYMYADEDDEDEDGDVEREKEREGGGSSSSSSSSSRAREDDETDDEDNDGLCKKRPRFPTSNIGRSAAVPIPVSDFKYLSSKAVENVDHCKRTRV